MKIHVDPKAIAFNRSSHLGALPVIVVREQWTGETEMVYRTNEVTINGPSTVVYREGAPLFEGGPEVWIECDPFDAAFEPEGRALVTR